MAERDLRRPRFQKRERGCFVQLASSTAAPNNIHWRTRTRTGLHQFRLGAVTLVFLLPCIHSSAMHFKRFALAFLVFFSTGNASRAADRSSNPPNVIIILADDLGYGDLACYGHPTFKTPNLDRMAREGARLTQFNTPAPFCAPTRASLMTGRYPFHCGLTANPAPDFGGQYTE